jgi:type I restriction enzyme, S subunit
VEKRISRLDDVCEVIMGQAPSGEAYNKDGKGWLLIAGAGDFGVLYPAPKKFTTEASKLSRSGDIILGIRATIGVKVLSDGEYSLGRGVAAIRAKSTIDSRYLWHCLEDTRFQLSSKARGATFKQVSKQDICELEIPLPPIAQQKRIAAILDQAEALRSHRREAIGLLDELGRSVFLEMFGDVEATSRFPVQPLESVLKRPLQNGAYFPKDAYVDNGGIEMVHMSDAFYEVVIRGNLKQVVCSDDEYKKYCLSEEDLLVARRSLTYEGAAKPCLIPRSPEPLIFESSFIRVTPNSEKIDVLFLFHYLSNDWVKQKCIRPFVTQSTISGINQSNLARVPILIPPLPLQQEFAQRIAAIEALKTTQKEALSQLDALFASLQHRAFRGEL